MQNPTKPVLHTALRVCGLLYHNGEVHAVGHVIHIYIEESTALFLLAHKL